MSERYYLGEIGPAELRACPPAGSGTDPVLRLLRRRLGSSLRREGAALLRGGVRLRLRLPADVTAWLTRWEAGARVGALRVWLEVRPGARYPGLPSPASGEEEA